MKAHVLIVTSEAVPLIKTGGLADVISSLAHHLQILGIDATVMLPAYPAAVAAAKNLREGDRLTQLPGGDGQLLFGTMPDTGVPIVLLKTPGFDRRNANPYVDEQGVEFDDNAICFGALSHAAVRICAGETTLPKPQIVHANDWHAALIPALLRLKNIHDLSTVLTIHNLAFQGNFSMHFAAPLGIPESMLTPDGFEYWGKLSFLKGGIKYADRITTVSRSYAEEILTPHFGHGMDGMLNTRKENLVAIPNGVDTDSWDPQKDELIAHHFTKSDMRGKADCKRELQQLFGLPENPHAPVLALGSRITHQKMADVALAVLPDILQRYPDAQAVVLGCGDRRYEQGFRELANRFPARVGICIGYDERHAHTLHAGADMLLHGTRFEPFGLTPLYAMRYGTIPIASRVGGIIDSISDAGLHGPVPVGACGILFDGEEPSEMAAAVVRAFELHSHAEEWQEMQRNAMTVDLSWRAPAKMYIDLYRSIAPAGSESLFVECAATEAKEEQNEIQQMESVMVVPVNEVPANSVAVRPAKRKKARGEVIKLPLKAATMLVQ